MMLLAAEQPEPELAEQLVPVEQPELAERPEPELAEQPSETEQYLQQDLLIS